MGTNIDTLFPCGIAKFVDTLLVEGKIGVCSGIIRILDEGTSCSTLTKGPCKDRFKVFVPYAGQNVIWEVLFQYHEPTEPPDFIFGPDDTDFVPDIVNIKSLYHWNHQDPYALTNVMVELLDEYKKHQARLIDNYSRLQFEYNSLIGRPDFNESDIEVLVTKKGQRIGPVNFLIRLPIDFSKIPGYLTKDNPGEDTAVLLVTFQSPDGAVSPKLFLSPRVEHALGGSANLRIPGFPNGSALVDYVPQVCELLKNKVEQVAIGFEKRKEYISAFLSHYGKAVLEYDTETYSKISFLFEWHDFSYTLIVNLPQGFPTQKPVFSFQSIYHQSQDDRPYMVVVEDYPYSPRWSGSEMAERARTFMIEYVGTFFQKASVKDGHAL